MEASSAPAKRISVGDVVGETFRVYRDNVGALLGSAVVVFLVVGLLSTLLEIADSAALSILATILYFAGHALYTGFVVKLVQDVRDGQRNQTVGDLFSAVRPVILPLVAFAILETIGVGIGLILLIVPGLILLTHWSLGAPAIVIERIGPIDALRRSWRLVRGNAWSVFGVLLVTGFIVGGIGIALAAIATPIGNGEAATYVASFVSAVVTAPILALAASIMYFNLGGGPLTAPPLAAPIPAD